MRSETALEAGATQSEVKIKGYKNVDITNAGKATAIKLPYIHSHTISNQFQTNFMTIDLDWKKGV